MTMLSCILMASWRIYYDYWFIKLFAGNTKLQDARLLPTNQPNCFQEVDIGEDSTKILDFQELGKGFTIDLKKMKEGKCYWVMAYGQSWNFIKYKGKLQFWEPNQWQQKNRSVCILI